MPRWLLLGLLSCCSFLLLGLASPNAHAEDKAKALKLLDKGDKLLTRGDRFMEQNKPDKGIAAYEEALAVYNEAYEAFNSPKIYFPIARAEQRLGRNMDAMGHYQAMLKESDNPKPELVKEVDKAIAEVRKKLVALDLTVEQNGAVVSVDGKDIGLTPLDGPHYMTPGEHKYTVTLDGHSPAEEIFDLDPGKIATRHIRLDSLRVTVEDKPKTSKPKKPKGKGGDSAVSSKPLTISFGAAGALFIGAGFTGIAAMGKHDRFEDLSLSSDERTAAQDSGKTFRLVTDVLLVSGVLAAGYGTYYYYTKYKGSKEARKSASKLQVSPYATGQGAGVALGATF